MYRNDIEELTQDEQVELLELNGIITEDYVTTELVCELLEITMDCIEADVLDDLYNGNWTDGAERLYEAHKTPANLVDYIQEQRDYHGEAYTWFSLPHAVSLTDIYNEHRRKAL